MGDGKYRGRGGYILGEITCLPLPEQAYIQLVTGPLPCRNCGNAFSSPLCKLGYRFLPWNPEMENFVGAPTGIEPASPAFRAGVLTTTPQHPGTKCIKFASSNHPWQMVLQHVVIFTVFSHCESSTYTVVQALNHARAPGYGGLTAAWAV